VPSGVPGNGLAAPSQLANFQADGAMGTRASVSLMRRVSE
jgi:hypothetical protein